jgi:hypothetical protein
VAGALLAIPIAATYPAIEKLWLRDQLGVLGIFFNLPFGRRLRSEFDVGDVGVDAIRRGLWRACLPLFFLPAPLGFLLATLDQSLLALTLCSGGSGISSHAR